MHVQKKKKMPPKKENTTDITGAQLKSPLPAKVLVSTLNLAHLLIRIIEADIIENTWITYTYTYIYIYIIKKNKDRSIMTR